MKFTKKFDNFHQATKKIPRHLAKDLFYHSLTSSLRLYNTGVLEVRLS